jgi:hypothetical protein
MRNNVGPIELSVIERSTHTMSAPNDQCPCGSGKKYKHCCQREESAQRLPEPPAADSTSQAGAVEKAIAWLADRHRKGWQASYQRLFDEVLGSTDLQKLGQLDEETLGAIEINLTEWLLAEGEIQARGSNRRIPDYLTGPSGPSWTVGQRDWLQQLGQRPLRVYNVTDVEPGVGMTLCDALDGDAAPMLVQERAGSQGLAPGVHLGCRVMRVGDHFELSGAVYPFSMLHEPVVLARLRAIGGEVGHLPELAQEQGLIVITTWLEQFLAPPPLPTMIDQGSGEPIVPITDHYRVLGWEVLAGALQRCADVDGNRHDGWARFIDCADGQSRPLAHIGIGKKVDQIEISYMTQTQADQGRTWFDSLAAGAVVFLTRKKVRPENILRQSKKSGASRSKDVNLPHIDPKELAKAMEELVHRTYANWANEPIPALDNKTPLQAIQSAAGLERAKGLLRSYEANEKTMAAQQGRAEISYDFLWKSLGLPRS